MIRFLLVGLVAYAVTPAWASQVVLDYRDPAFRNGEATASSVDRTRLGRIMAEEAPAALQKEMGQAFVVLGDAQGAFTRPGARERVYLVQEKRPVAIDPFPNAAAPVLVVLGESAKARFFRLPKDVQYQRLVAAADADRDGLSEVLLESAFTNMGESVTAVTAVKLEADRATPMQVLQDVFTDSCDGGTSRKRRMASAVSVDGSGTFTARRYTLGCR